MYDQPKALGSNWSDNVYAIPEKRRDCDESGTHKEMLATKLRERARHGHRRTSTKRKSADIERKRNTIIARMIVAISAGALSCTHDDARRLVRSWSDGKVVAVYNEIVR